ncbi:MAG TPA: tetratricopeptide repeat protein, partial [Gemmatirosa sp.]|nr:tetratricopeptide repeat protein [Gemmatirosa sp.]
RWLLGAGALAAVALAMAVRGARPRPAPARPAQAPAAMPRGDARRTDSATHELYLRGRHAFHNRIADDGVRQASRYFAEAVARDPDFAPAHAGLADAYTRMAAFGYADPPPTLRLAKEAARRAVALDPALAAGHVALAHALLLGDCAWDAAEREFRHAHALDPTYAFGRAPFAMLLLGRGRHDEALAQLDTARAAEPLAPWVANVRGRVLVSAGRPDEAIQVLEEALTLYPGLDLAHQQLGHAYLARRMPDRAVAAFRRGAALHGARDSAQLAYAYAVTGDRAAARRIVRRLTAPSRPAHGPTGPSALAYHIAMAYAGLGEHDVALDWLERARMGGALCPIPAAVEPGFRALHASPRWRLLLSRMGLPVRSTEAR